MPWSCSVRIISSPVRSPTCASRGYLWPPKLRCRIRPSEVRSKSAPHASSSFTRSGASLACSSAMRQLLMYCPPRMVSAKWTRQLSRSSTFAVADDEHVVFDRVLFCVHRILKSCQIPIEHMRTYRSANATPKRLIHAHFMCQRFKQLEQSYETFRAGCFERLSRNPPTTCRIEWQPSV